MHCSKGVQPKPKAVYCSGCRDKHNCCGEIQTRVLSHTTVQHVRIRPLRPATLSVNAKTIIMVQHKIVKSIKKLPLRFL